VIEFFHISFTFAWNNIDLFLIIQNLALTLRFEQLNDQLLRFRGKPMHEFFWNETRRHFVALCELLEYLDRKLGPIILFSCLNNLYFICFNLLNVFK
jgi:gustatory receptor